MVEFLLFVIFFGLLLLHLMSKAEQHTNNSGAITCHSAGSVPCLELTCGDNISLSEFSNKTQLPAPYPPCEEGEKEQHAEMMLSEAEVDSVSLPSISSLSDLSTDETTSLSMISDISSKNLEESVLCTKTEVASVSSLPSVTSLSDLSCDETTSLSMMSDISSINQEERVLCTKTEVASLPSVISLNDLSCDQTSSLSMMSDISSINQEERVLCTKTEVASLPSVISLNDLSCDETTSLSMMSDISSKNLEESVLCTKTEVASISSLPSVTSRSDLASLIFSDYTDNDCPSVDEDQSGQTVNATNNLIKNGGKKKKTNVLRRLRKFFKCIN